MTGRKWMSLYRSFANKLPYLIASIRDACFPVTSITKEKDFLVLQSKLRGQNTSVLQEAMYSLDCIDVKAQSLLSYISISIAALVFQLSEIHSSSILDKKEFTNFILILLVCLSVAIVLCLSCVNIIGAHTVMLLKSQEEKKKLDEYNDLVLRVTLNRRTRYLIAHRLSVTTAVFLGILFALRLFGIV
jgi:hypothetical protein